MLLRASHTVKTGVDYRLCILMRESPSPLPISGTGGFTAGRSRSRSEGDHLAFRILIQLGLRSEELFALRRDDVVGDTLRIDEAIVEGASATVKTTWLRFARGVVSLIPASVRAAAVALESELIGETYRLRVRIMRSWALDH